MHTSIINIISITARRVLSRVRLDLVTFLIFVALEAALLPLTAVTSVMALITSSTNLMISSIFFALTMAGFIPLGRICMEVARDKTHGRTSPAVQGSPELEPAYQENPSTLTA